MIARNTGLDLKKVSQLTAPIGQKSYSLCAGNPTGCISSSVALPMALYKYVYDTI